GDLSKRQQSLFWRMDGFSSVKDVCGDTRTFLAALSRAALLVGDCFICMNMKSLRRPLLYWPYGFRLSGYGKLTLGFLNRQKLRRGMNMEMNFFWVAVGLALMGYFIGNGLKN